MHLRSLYWRDRVSKLLGSRLERGRAERKRAEPEVILRDPWRALLHSDFLFNPLFWPCLAAQIVYWRASIKAIFISNIMLLLAYSLMQRFVIKHQICHSGFQRKVHRDTDLAVWYSITANKTCALGAKIYEQILTFGTKTFLSTFRPDRRAREPRRGLRSGDGMKDMKARGAVDTWIPPCLALIITWQSRRHRLLAACRFYQTARAVKPKGDNEWTQIFSVWLCLLESPRKKVVLS